MNPDSDPLNAIAYGPLIGLAVAVVLYWLARDGKWKRWHRRHRGACPHCGHDLRSNFAAGCPECGWRRKPANGVRTPTASEDAKATTAIVFATILNVFIFLPGSALTAIMCAASGLNRYLMEVAIAALVFVASLASFSVVCIVHRSSFSVGLRTTAFLLNAALVVLAAVVFAMRDYGLAPFAIAFVGAINSLFIIYSRLHWRLGQCPMCGFHLDRGRRAGCPECGWRREPANDARSTP